MAITPVGPVGWPLPAEGAGLKTGAAPAEGPFGRVVEGLLGQANTQQGVADQAVRELAAGNADSLHGAMLAVAKADLSFRMVLEIRNRLTDAFQEIMRMQV